MLKDKLIGVIGAGAMGSALCRGLVDSNTISPNRILVGDTHKTRAVELQDSVGVKIASTNSQIAKFTDIVILAIKPFMVTTVLDEAKDAFTRENGKPLPLIISIAAGIRIKTLEMQLL